MSTKSHETDGVLTAELIEQCVDQAWQARLAPWSDREQEAFVKMRESTRMKIRSGLADLNLLWTEASCTYSTATTPQEVEMSGQKLLAVTAVHFLHRLGLNREQAVPVIHQIFDRVANTHTATPDELDRIAELELEVEELKRKLQAADDGLLTVDRDRSAIMAERDSAIKAAQDAKAEALSLNNALSRVAAENEALRKKMDADLSNAQSKAAAINSNGPKAVGDGDQFVIAGLRDIGENLIAVNHEIDALTEASVVKHKRKLMLAAMSSVLCDLESLVEGLVNPATQKA